MPVPVTWKQSRQADPDRKWRKLLAHPLWDEIETRLRSRWSPRRVVIWLEREHPKTPKIHFVTMYRYLQDKPAGWFIDPLVFLEGHRGYSRVSRLMVMEEHAEAFLLLKRRVDKAAELEAGFDGMLYPEVRANIELLARMTEQHLKMQQALGYAPAGGQYARVQGMPLNEDDGGNDRGWLTFVNKMVQLPEQEFLELVRLALGSPPKGTEPVDTVSDVRPRRAGGD